MNHPGQTPAAPDSLLLIMCNSQREGNYCHRHYFPEWPMRQVRFFSVRDGLRPSHARRLRSDDVIVWYNGARSQCSQELSDLVRTWNWDRLAVEVSLS